MDLAPPAVHTMLQRHKSCQKCDREILRTVVTPEVTLEQKISCHQYECNSRMFRLH